MVSDFYFGLRYRNPMLVIPADTVTLAWSPYAEFFDKRKIILFKPLNKSSFIITVIACVSIEFKYCIVL